jgi:hypothetical protein
MNSLLCDRGSLVRLTVENGAPAVPLVIGFVLIALLVCAMALDFLPVVVYGGVPVIFVGIIKYLVVSIRARTALGRLLRCLESMLSAEPAD